MKLLILERDGVINQYLPQGVRSLADWQPIPGSIEALARLSRAGFTLVIATNQPILSTGLIDLDQLEAIHAHLTQVVEEAGGEISAIFYCPHEASDGCNCHKPKPGLIDAIEAEFDVCASEVPMVGHSLSDLLAADQKDGDPILVLTGLGETSAAELEKTPALQGTPVFADLAAAADHIIARYP